MLKKLVFAGLFATISFISLSPSAKSVQPKNTAPITAPASEDPQVDCYNFCCMCGCC